MSVFSKTKPLVGTLMIQTYQVYPDGSIAQHGSYVTAWMQSQWHNSVKTPSYRTLSKSQLPRNPFSSGIIRYERTPGSAVSTSGSSRVGIMDYYWPQLYYATGHHGNYNINADRAEVEQALLPKVGNMKFNAAQAWAERKQTASTLEKTVVRFSKAAKAFKDCKKSLFLRLCKAKDTKPRHIFPKKWKTRDAFASAWLEYSYAWLPMLGDIYGAAELLSDQINSTRPLRASARIDKTVVKGPTGRYPWISDIQTVSVRANSVVSFEISDHGKELLSRTGITNPLLLGWELIPLSFVADWFIPVGTYLGNLTATSGLKFLGGSTTVITNQSDKVRVIGSPDGSWTITGGDYTRDVKTIDRYILSAFPSPTLPSLENPFSLRHSASALSLIQTIFRPFKGL